MPGRSLAIFDAAGEPLSGRWEGLPRGSAEALGERGHAALTVETPQGPFRLYRARHRHGETTYQVGAAESLAPVHRELSGLRRTLLGSVLFALLLAVRGGGGGARAAAAPGGAAGGRPLPARASGRGRPPPRPRPSVSRGAGGDLRQRAAGAARTQGSRPG